LINEINRELSNLNEKISKIKAYPRDSGTDKRKETENVFVNSLGEVMQKVKGEFEKEKRKREDFEENIFTLLEETCTRLANSD
jgi:hypothetical protein